EVLEGIRKTKAPTPKQLDLPLEPRKTSSTSPTQLELSLDNTAAAAEVQPLPVGSATEPQSPSPKLAVSEPIPKATVSAEATTSKVGVADSAPKATVPEP